MKAIVDLSAEEYQRQMDTLNNLREAIKDHKISELMTVNYKYGYAHYKFTGTYNQLLTDLLGREPASDEIIMLVDYGFSHFGASCRKGDNRSFSGRVNTD